MLIHGMCTLHPGFAIAHQAQPIPPPRTTPSVALMAPAKSAKTKTAAAMCQRDAPWAESIANSRVWRASASENTGEINRMISSAMTA